jgi:hypothetical protein
VARWKAVSWHHHRGLALNGVLSSLSWVRVARQLWWTVRKACLAGPYRLSWAELLSCELMDFLAALIEYIYQTNHHDQNHTWQAGLALYVERSLVKSFCRWAAVFVHILEPSPQRLKYFIRTMRSPSVGYLRKTVYFLLHTINCWKDLSLVCVSMFLFLFLFYSIWSYILL